MYFQRKSHKLTEWHQFCDWILTLPYAKELITYTKENRRNLSDVGQFDGIKDEVDYVISNKGYSWSPLNMAHIIKRSMEWMKC